jgi:hypothetical protein
MKSSRQVQQIVGQARLQADRVIDERILGDARAALSASMNNRPQAPRPGPAIWRTIMESRITKYSVAATIVLTASLVLLNPFGRNSVVLGDVAQKLSETRTVMHKEKRLAWRPGEDKPFFEGEARKYISTDIGFMEEQYDPNGALLYRALLLKEGQIILVFPQTKRYIKLPARGRLYEELVKTTTPTGMVNYFTAMPYTKLGRSRVGAVEAEGFEVSNVDFSFLPDCIRYLFPIQNLSARLWVDAESSLPVEIEMKMDADRGLLNGFQRVHAEFTAYDFEWDAPLPEGILDPNIPPDYTQIDLGSIASENAAWLGIGALPVIGIVVRRRRRRTRSCRRKTLMTA